MNDIVERLSGLYDEWSSPHSSPDGLPTGASIMLDAADEITRLRAENERLRAALESVMIGGNSLAQIIRADHPPHGTPYGEALTHYGGGVKYEAWCCWNAIMLARAALVER